MITLQQLMQYRFSSTATDCNEVYIRFEGEIVGSIPPRCHRHNIFNVVPGGLELEAGATTRSKLEAKVGNLP